MKLHCGKRFELGRKAEQENIKKLLSLLPSFREPVNVLDVGCNDGQLSLTVASFVNCANVYGIEINCDALAHRDKNILPVCADLNKGFPFCDEVFHLVISNQVIEHLCDIDSFVKEIWRVLKPQGYAIISTDNLASWHNILALLFGYQDFSQNISKERTIGNPLSPHYMKPLGSWVHNKILSYRSLAEIFLIHGFTVEVSQGAGYPPFSGRLSSFLSKINPSHAKFITIRVRKKI